MSWKASDPMGNEARKVAWEVVKWTRGRGLDIGCGPGKTFPHWIGVDNCADEKLFGIKCNPDIKVEDCGKLDVLSSQSMDFCFSSHLLEHVEPERVTAVLKEWMRLIKTKGYLILYLPDEDEYPKIGEEGANKDHKWNVNYDQVVRYMKDAGSWDLVDFQKRNEDREYSLLFVFQKVGSGQHFSFRNPKPAKTVGVVRYGAFGDLLQSSSVFAGLKAQGYHVTLYTSPPGDAVVRFDPNIDAFYIQDKDQVPNALLSEFWAHHKKKYDKWVNLCESVEGNFLTLPGRSVHEWPPLARHRVTNFNYVEHQHTIAGVPNNVRVKFYSTESEREWARKERAKMGKKVLVWSLAGSAVHKTWPYLDQVIAAIMVKYPEWDVVFMGSEACKILEQGWENEKRVHRMSGKWEIRNSMAFLEQADCVVGPETGIMNAASGLDVPKVVFLSHSSDENLTRDWDNCISLSSAKTVCPGRGNNDVPACHQMHYGWDYCKKTEDGVAQCQADISFEQGWHAVEHAMNHKVRAVA